MKIMTTVPHDCCEIVGEEGLCGHDTVQHVGGTDAHSVVICVVPETWFIVMCLLFKVPLTAALCYN